MEKIMAELKRAGACADGYDCASKHTDPATFFTTLVKKNKYWLAWVLKHTTLATSNVLAVFASDEYWRVRYAVASNPSTPPASLSILAGNAELGVRDAAEWGICNALTPPAGVAG